MAYLFKHQKPPPSWKAFGGSRHPLLRPIFFVEWIFRQTAYRLSHWTFLELLEYLGSLSILLATISYFTESGARRQQKHYEAWQVINTAQGKGGSGGRIEALQMLAKDHIPLVGIDVSGAFLQGVNLEGAGLRRANLQRTDLRVAQLARANLADAELQSANLRGANLREADLSGADLTDADLVGAGLHGARLAKAHLASADLRDVDLGGVKEWNAIADIKLANVYGVKNPPEGFVSWAMSKGAVSSASDTSPATTKP